MSETFEIKSRLIALAGALELSMRSFSTSIDKAPTWLQGITKDVGTIVLTRIIVKYPQVNMRWLLLGEGEMFITNEESSSNKDSLTQYLEKRIQVLEEENKKQAQEILELNILLAKKETELELTNVYQCEKNEGLSPSLSSLDIKKKQFEE